MQPCFGGDPASVHASLGNATARRKIDEPKTPWANSPVSSEDEVPWKKGMACHLSRFFATSLRTFSGESPWSIEIHGTVECEA